MFLQWKCRDIHQCHSGSSVLAAALLAVSNEIVKISFCSLPSRQGLIFIPWFSTWISPFVYDQWDCVCFQKLSGFVPGRLSCWAVVVLQVGKKTCLFSRSPRLIYKAEEITVFYRSIGLLLLWDRDVLFCT